MGLRGQIGYLLGLSGDELKGSHAAELEDLVQRGLMAVHSGEMWIRHVARELETATPERAALLERELARSRDAVEEVRRHVAALCERARELGVGTPAATA